MAGYLTNIERSTLRNKNFRKVLFTGPHSQLVLMSLKPGEEIGLETHHTIDQFFRVEAGQGKALLNGKEHELESGSALVVPAGTQHNIINVSPDADLKLYTIYSPAAHPKGTVHKTREEAVAAEKEHQH